LSLCAGGWRIIAITADFDNTEQLSGVTLPAKCAVLNAWVDVTTADTSQTLDVGTDSTDSGDANGFLAAVSVNGTGIVKGTLASGGQTLGELLRVDESGAGVLVPEPSVSQGGKEISYTGSDTTNTMRGTIYVEIIEFA